MFIGGVEVGISDYFVSWVSGANVDADGSPMAYAPANSELPALDRLDNAGHPGRWESLVTDTGKPDGEPLVQGPDDPWPGYYISTTALQDHSKKLSDPARYVDSVAVPYVVIPPELEKFCRLGDVAWVTFQQLSSAAIVADVGPYDKIGEISIALALRLGINHDPKSGGVSAGVSFTILRESSQGWPRTVEDIDAQVRMRFHS